MIKLARNVRAMYAVLTDELTHVTVSFQHCTLDTSMPYLSIESAEDLQLRLRIAAGVYNAAADRDLVRNASESPHYVEGTLNDPRREASYNPEEKKWLSDFDLFTMQRDSDLWFECACWHEKVQQEALSNPVSVGSNISVEPGGFARRIGLLRSPYPTQPLPQDTIGIFRSRTKRPRNEALDRTLGSSQYLTMTIVDTVRTGPRQFSQVFIARLSGCDETFCLKLFDERHFPIPWIRDPECIIGPPQIRLLSLNFSEDLARREEAVYDRLSDLQGSLLPHCYGFHMARTVKLTFSPNPITQVRHGIRVLRANGISQTDWHPSQVLCNKQDGGDVDIVLIDFAFALMYLGDEGGIPTRPDITRARYMFSQRLDVERDLLDKHWLPPLDFEY
ncbi:hypothetical protein EIP86_005373 [Pleurotus ostreatoroseus]|nr:hypothetical protein EIP86_005373 [Pleurotus ostreatoroseus]